MNGEVKFFGDGPKEIQVNTSAQVYRLRDWLLEGKRVTCDVARLQLGIGGSALPRRIKDCRDFLNMEIKARWVPYLTSMGTKTRIREYYMGQNEIDTYLINFMGLKVIYPPRNDRKPSMQMDGAEKFPSRHLQHAVI